MEDSVAREMIRGLGELHKAHVSECNARMEYIQASLTDARTSRRGIYTRLNAMIIAVLVFMVTCAGYLYVQNEQLKYVPVKSLMNFQTNAGNPNDESGAGNPK